MAAGFVLVAGLTVAAYGLYCLYVRTIKARCSCKTDLSGKTVLVTGADKGIGYYTALDLAQRNARVILACHNPEIAEAAAGSIQLKTGNKNVVVRRLELSLLESVHQFASEIIENEDRLDILINNAATADTRDEKTNEGLNYMFATNYIGPFLLTNLLLDKLKQSAPSRIVNVASIAHKWLTKPFDLKHLNAENDLPKHSWYSYTKLELILFTRELSRRLQGTGVTANSLHPGSVQTNLFHSIPWAAKLVMYTIQLFFFRTTEEGAQTSIHVAVSKELSGVSGEYFSECCIAKPSKCALDDGLAKKLYELSEKYAQLQ